LGPLAAKQNDKNDTQKPARRHWNQLRHSLVNQESDPQEQWRCRISL